MELKHTIDVGKVAQREAERWTIVTNLVGYKGFILRLKIARLLIRFAAWIVGMNYEEDQNVISLKGAKIE